MIEQIEQRLLHAVGERLDDGLFVYELGSDLNESWQYLLKDRQRRMRCGELAVAVQAFRFIALTDQIVAAILRIGLLQFRIQRGEQHSQHTDLMKDAVLLTKAGGGGRLRRIDGQTLQQWRQYDVQIVHCHVNRRN